MSGANGATNETPVTQTPTLAQLIPAHQAPTDAATRDAMVEAALRYFPNASVRINTTNGEIFDIANNEVIGNAYDPASYRGKVAGASKPTKHAAGTLNVGSGDPRTIEQNAALQLALAGRNSSVLPASYANRFLLPNGTWTDDPRAMTIPPARQKEITDKVTTRTYAFALNADGLPISYVPAADDVASYERNVGDFNAGRRDADAAARAAAVIAQAQTLPSTPLANALPLAGGNNPTGENVTTFGRTPIDEITERGAASVTTATLNAPENAVNVNKVTPVLMTDAPAVAPWLAMLGIGAALWWLSQNGN